MTRAAAEEASAIFASEGDRVRLAVSLSILRNAAEAEGKHDETRSLEADVEAIYRELGNIRGLSSVLENRGYSELVLGNYDAAEPLLRESLALGSPSPSHVLLNLGLALLGNGRPDEARTAFAQSLAEGASTEAPEQVLYALEGLASVAASVAEDETAARLWGASEALRESIGVIPRPGRARATRAARPREPDTARRRQIRGRLGGGQGDAHRTSRRILRSERRPSGTDRAASL